MPENPKNFSPWTLSLILLLVLLAGKNILAWNQVISEGDFRLGSMIQDDGYYYLQIAENILDGRGATFDGIHPTTGFQPLYQGLTVLFSMLSRFLGVSVFKTIYLANFLLVIAASLILFKALLRLNPRLDRLWLISGVLIALPLNFPLVFKRLACGMEMGLSLFLLSCAFYLVCRWPRAPQQIPAFGLAGGLVMGLLGLTRIDFFLFGVLFLAALLWRTGREDRLRTTILYLAGFTVPVGIYVLAAGPHLETLVPVSFLAKKHSAAAWKEAASGIHFMGAFLAGAAKMWIFPLGFSVFGFYSLGGKAGLMAAVLTAGLCGGILLYRRGFAAVRQRETWVFPLVWVGATALLHAVLLAWGGPTFIRSARFWYYAPQLLLLSVTFFWLLGASFSGTDRWFGAVILLILTVSTLGYDPRRDIDSYEPLRQSVVEASKIIPASATVGSWDAGFNAYWLRPRTTINLDGMANSREYLEQVLFPGDVDGYLQRENVSYLLNIYSFSEKAGRILREKYFRSSRIPRAHYDILADIPFERQNLRIILARYKGPGEISALPGKNR